MRIAISTCLIAAMPLACGGTDRSSAAGGGDVAAGETPSLGGGARDGSGPEVAPTGAPLLYAHTDTTLYRADPSALASSLVKVGDFDCVGAGKPAKTMTDIAVTREGKVFGVSEGAAFPLAIQGGTVHCEATWSLPATKFYGLTVAPENTVAPAETLVAADGDGGLWLVDQASGTPTQVGTLGTDPTSGRPWALSGDIVFLANGGSPVGFATVRTCTASGSCSSVDTLIEVSVKAIHPGKQSVLASVRGPVKRGAWCTNGASPSTFGSMFGIVAYQEKVFGFSRTGDIVEIHNDDGSGCLVSADPSQRWAGAGITTLAPVVAPPVK